MIICTEPDSSLCITIILVPLKYDNLGVSMTVRIVCWEDEVVTVSQRSASLEPEKVASLRD